MGGRAGEGSGSNKEKRESGLEEEGWRRGGEWKGKGTEKVKVGGVAKGRQGLGRGGRGGQGEEERGVEGEGRGGKGAGGRARGGG